MEIFKSAFLQKRKTVLLAYYHDVGETGEQPKTFRYIKKYIHILQQIFLIQKVDTCLRYDYRPSVQFKDILGGYSLVESSGGETAQTCPGYGASLSSSGASSNTVRNVGTRTRKWFVLN